MKTKQAVKALAALAQESRLKTFRLLVEAGEEGMPAGEIADRLKLPAATLSFHLKELAATGLIAANREGRSLIYSLRPEAMNELLQFLMQDCCQGRPELCQPNFKNHNGDICCDSDSKRTRSKPRKKRAKAPLLRKR